MSIDELEALLDRAFPEGDWAIWDDLHRDGFVTIGNLEGVIQPGSMVSLDDPNPVAEVYTPELAELIVALRNEAPKLIELVKNLQHELIATEISRGDIATERDRLAEAIAGSPDKAKRLASLVASSIRLVQTERDDARAECDRLRETLQALAGIEADR